MVFGEVARRALGCFGTSRPHDTDTTASEGGISDEDRLTRRVRKKLARDGDTVENDRHKPDAKMDARDKGRTLKRAVPALVY